MVDDKVLDRGQRLDMKSLRSLQREEMYYLANLTFYFATNIDSRINYGPALEKIRNNYPKYLMTMDHLLQERNGIHHVGLADLVAGDKAL